MSVASAVAEQPMLLNGAVFELLVRKVPAAVLQEVPPELFPEVIGITRERFEEIVRLVGADGRTRGLVGRETAGYLRRALGMALLERSPAKFLMRFGAEQADARVLMRQLSAPIAVQTNASARDGR